MKAKDKLIQKMQREKNPRSELTRYLSYRHSEWPEEADALMTDLVELFSSEKGLRVLLLLTKATVEMSVANGADERALRENNAVRNFVLDIRRIVAHG